MLSHKNIDVIILCGGLGKRLRCIINDPKPMAEINERPFLDILIDHVSSYGFTRYILCTGYKGDVIRKFYSKKNNSLTFIFSEEKEALGTAGAIKYAESHINSDPFLVLNGDSFCPVDLHNFLYFHISKGSDLSIALSDREDSGSYGHVNIDKNQKIMVFDEKQRKGEGLVNAGVYLFNRSILSVIPSNTVYSIEHDLFPSLAGKYFYGYMSNSNFIDIGTPERYEQAKNSEKFMLMMDNLQHI